jgi:Fungal Zn(2)-Cys(6) binuclear cluster domain
MAVNSVKSSIFNPPNIEALEYLQFKAPHTLPPRPSQICQIKTNQMAERLDQAAQREDRSAHLSQPTSGRGSIGAGHDGDQSPRPKRRRITLACNACRDRKVRCDGRRPICSRCAKKRIESECIYEESSLKTQKCDSQAKSFV